MTDSCIRLSLDLQQTDTGITVRAKRGDTGTVLRSALADDGAPYQIAEDCYAVFTGKKADKTVIYNQCSIENNEILYFFTEQTCAAPGRIQAEIRLYSTGGKLITAAGFLLEVYDTVCHPEDLLSQDEMDALDALILEMWELKEQLSEQQLTLQTDGSLTFRDGILSVNTTEDMEQDNTLPMSSAGVYATVGNIAQLLKTI
jgi:hypothetical protein